MTRTLTLLALACSLACSGVPYNAPILSTTVPDSGTGSVIVRGGEVAREGVKLIALDATSIVPAPSTRIMYLWASPPASFELWRFDYATGGGVDEEGLGVRDNRDHAPALMEYPHLPGTTPRQCWHSWAAACMEWEPWPARGLIVESGGVAAPGLRWSLVAESGLTALVAGSVRVVAGAWGIRPALDFKYLTTFHRRRHNTIPQKHWANYFMDSLVFVATGLQAGDKLRLERTWP